MVFFGLIIMVLNVICGVAMLAMASNKTSLSQSDFDLGTTITYPVIGDWTVHMGSILKIDDISLAFDK